MIFGNVSANQPQTLEPEQLAQICYCGNYPRGQCPNCPAYLSLLDRVNGVPLRGGCCGS
ncbi:MAG: hypothetical protein U0Q18_25300 [Bryobacteraceae bacterium]